MRKTVKDIARHAGVSPATVSLVLRKSPLVAIETRERVQTSIDALGYVYDRAAANMRARATHTIGLVVCEITNPFYAELTAGIDDTLDRAGWVAFLANTAELPKRQDRFIARMREHRVDGLLLAPAEGTDPAIVDDLRTQGLPVVTMLRRLDTKNTDQVSTDFRLGMTLAAEHLIRLGHKRIAFRRRRQERIAGARPRRRLPRNLGALRACRWSRSELLADERGRRTRNRCVATWQVERSDSCALLQ